MFQCLTLSSACMFAYRKNFLPQEKNRIVPPGGYHGRGKQSHAALRWLDFVEHKIGHKISTIYTDREVSVLGRRGDGYVKLPLPDGSTERGGIQSQKWSTHEYLLKNITWITCNYTQFVNYGYYLTIAAITDLLQCYYSNYRLLQQ